MATRVHDNSNAAFATPLSGVRWGTFEVSRINRRWWEVLDHPRFIWVAFGTYVAFRAALMFLVPVQPTSDALWYYNRAAGLAAGQGYSEQGLPTAYWPVGWPGALAAWFTVFGTSVVAGKLLNLVAAAASFFLTLRLALLMTGSRQVARLSVFVLALYPNNAAYPGLLLSEVWASFLLLSVCWIYLEFRNVPGALAAGLFAGLAVLTKSQLLLFIPFVILLDALTERRSGALRRNLGRGALLAAAAAVIVLPWTYRNYEVFNAMVPVSTNSGLTLLTGNNPSARGSYTPDDPLVVDVLSRRTVANQLQIDREARALAIKWIADNPWEFTKLLPLKVWHLWAVDGEAAWEFEHGYRGFEEHRLAFTIARILNQAIYAVLLAGFAIGMICLMRPAADSARVQQGPPPTIWLAAAFVVVTTMITLIFSGQPRFHYATMPFIAIVACWAILRGLRVVASGPTTSARRTGLGALRYWSR